MQRKMRRQRTRNSRQPQSEALPAGRMRCDLYLSAVWRMHLRGKKAESPGESGGLRLGSNSTMFKRGQILGIEGEGKTGTLGVWILNHCGEDGDIQS